MGKKLVLHADGNIAPLLFTPAISGEEIKDEGILNGFNFKKGLELEYAINKKHSVGVFFHNFKSAVNENEMNINYYMLPTDDIYSSGNIELQTETHYTSFSGIVNANSFGVSWTSYRKGIAPFGVFTKFDAFYCSYTFDPRDVSATFYDDVMVYKDNDKFKTGLYIDDQYHTYGVSIHLGMQKVYFNRITTRLAFQTGIIFEGLHTYTSIIEEIIDSDAEYDATEAVFKASNASLMQNYLWGIDFGVGVLLF